MNKNVLTTTLEKLWYHLMVKCWYQHHHQHSLLWNIQSFLSVFGCGNLFVLFSKAELWDAILSIADLSTLFFYLPESLVFIIRVEKALFSDADRVHSYLQVRINSIHQIPCGDRAEDKNIEIEWNRSLSVGNK